MVAYVAASLLAALGCTRADGGSPPATSTSNAPGVTSAVSTGAPGSWRKPSEEELRRQLAPLSFAVTQQDATEPPFRNAYHDNHAPGLYVDVVSGEPLFSSLDKFDSGTGWPSFTRPVDASAVRTRKDWKLVLPRTEVRSAVADSHLGHVFDDGPPPTGQRWCMNSAAMRFVPVDRLAGEGYAAYLPLFAKAGADEAHGGKPDPAAAPAPDASPRIVPRENPPRPTPPER